MTWILIYLYLTSSPYTEQIAGFKDAASCLEVATAINSEKFDKVAYCVPREERE